MKNLIFIAVAVASYLFLTALTVSPVSAQATKTAVVKGSSLPEGILKIAEKSCFKCHSEPGNAMALAHVNFTKWDEYSPEKQAAKANAIYKMVSKNKMPPKNFRKSNPDTVPTKEEVMALSGWSQSIQVPKK